MYRALSCSDEIGAPPEVDIIGFVAEISGKKRAMQCRVGSVSLRVWDRGGRVGFLISEGGSMHRRPDHFLRTASFPAQGRYDAARGYR